MAPAGTNREDWVDETDYVPDGYELDGPPQDLPDVDDHDELITRICEWAAVLRRVGGIIMVSAVREERAPGLYVTTGYRFKWDSYGGPAQKLPKENGRRAHRHEVPLESVVDDGIEDDDIPDDHNHAPDAVFEGKA